MCKMQVFEFLKQRLIEFTHVFKAVEPPEMFYSVTALNEQYNL